MFPGDHRCSRCGEVKALDRFYLDKQGKVTGYCRDGCHAAWWRAYAAAGKATRRPHYARDWARRRAGIPEERWRQRDEAAS